MGALFHLSLEHINQLPPRFRIFILRVSSGKRNETELVPILGQRCLIGNVHDRTNFKYRSHIIGVNVYSLIRMSSVA